jgi:hypothetical protein
MLLGGICDECTVGVYAEELQRTVNLYNNSTASRPPPVYDCHLVT